jgi:hypothetical protein
VRDLVVRERIEALARDAAERLRGLVASGEEIPFGVAGPDEGSAFSQYAPQTGRFVREHWAALAELDAFSDARDAIVAAELAGPYLDQLDEPVPPDEDRRAEGALIALLSRLWEGYSDFPTDGEPLAAALRELEGCAEGPDGEAEVVAPLIGFHMPTVRLALEGATLVRADVIEVPDEVRRTEGTRHAAWEPQFLAVVRGPAAADEDPGSIGGTEAIAPGVALRKLVTTLRLFKAGGVGLAPYAWSRTPGDRWRRLATGAARPRPGAYRLTDSELGDLAALSRALGNGPRPLGGSGTGPRGGAGTVGRALSRFEAGLERPALLEALSDYLLALRYLLDGGGAADVGLPMRVAAICGEPAQRPEIKAQVERALALERTLMRGELPATGEQEGPLELVAEIEERARSILREAASGHLGSDLRAAADETLLADGLAVADGAVELRGATAEWDALEAPPAPHREASTREEETEMEEFASEGTTTVLMATETRTETKTESRQRETQPADWLSEVDSRGDTLDWPERPEALKLLDRRPAEREATRRRVRHLFPRPETTEWSVAELQYDRRRTRVRG